MVIKVLRPEVTFKKLSAEVQKCIINMPVLWTCLPLIHMCTDRSLEILCRSFRKSPSWAVIFQKILVQASHHRMWSKLWISCLRAETIVNDCLRASKSIQSYQQFLFIYNPLTWWKNAFCLILQIYDLKVTIDDGFLNSEKTFAQFELIHKQLQKYFIESMLPQWVRKTTCWILEQCFVFNIITIIWCMY